MKDTTHSGGTGMITPDEYQRLVADRDRLARDNERLRAALEAIALNAPDTSDEPIRDMNHGEAVAIAWAFWIAGQHAREALEGGG